MNQHSPIKGRGSLIERATEIFVPRPGPARPSRSIATG